MVIGKDLFTADTVAPACLHCTREVRSFEGVRKTPCDAPAPTVIALVRSRSLGDVQSGARKMISRKAHVLEKNTFLMCAIRAMRLCVSKVGSSELAVQ